MLNENQIGDAGAIGPRRFPEVSVISGKPLAPGFVTITFPGSPYTVAVRGQEWRAMSAEEKAAMRSEWARQLPSAGAVEPTQPALEEMSMADLDALALAENVDLTGRRTKADRIDAIRAARVVARFADKSSPVTPESEADNG